MKTIQAEWEEFADQMLTPEISGVHREFMRRVFYAGALSMSSLIDSCAGYDEESRRQMMITLREELHQFVEELMGELKD